MLSTELTNKYPHRAKDAMASPVIVLSHWPTVREVHSNTAKMYSTQLWVLCQVVQVLSSNNHHAFPVVMDKCGTAKEKLVGLRFHVQLSATHCVLYFRSVLRAQLVSMINKRYFMAQHDYESPRHLQNKRHLRRSVQVLNCSLLVQDAACSCVLHLKLGCCRSQMR